MKLELLPYKNVNLKTNKILEQLTLSSRALAELKGYLNTIPNMHILINEMKNYKEEFISKLPKIYSKELLESLFYEVYTKIAYIEKACNVTRITATSYLNQLEEIGLLESEKIGRERLYKNTRLIKLLSEN